MRTGSGLPARADDFPLRRSGRTSAADQKLDDVAIAGRNRQLRRSLGIEQLLQTVGQALDAFADLREAHRRVFGREPLESVHDFFGADLNEIYLTSGLNIAMPSCYPYEYYSQHTTPGQYGGSAPTLRSALFWAPLERFSVAKRALPEGHMLMPWTAPRKTARPLMNAPRPMVTMISEISRWPSRCRTTS